MTLDELLILISDNMSPEELVEILELSTEDIAYAFDHRIEADRHKFKDYDDGR